MHKRLAEVGITSSQDPSNEDQIPIIVADSNDTASLERMCAATKVIITLVGPYSRYGEALLKSAVDKGTHYCDLTVSKLVERFPGLAEPRYAGGDAFCRQIHREISRSCQAQQRSHRPCVSRTSVS